jgi:hypothetical protein
MRVFERKPRGNWGMNWLKKWLRDHGNNVSKYVRDLRGDFGMYWCDRCRIFTDRPTAHLHGDGGFLD